MVKKQLSLFDDDPNFEQGIDGRLVADDDFEMTPEHEVIPMLEMKRNKEKRKAKKSKEKKPPKVILDKDGKPIPF